MPNNITPIFGRLKNVTKEDPYVAGAADIKDDVKNKNQQTINQETDAHLGTHDTEIADRYTKEEVNNIVSRTPETDVIVIEVPAASQSDIAGWLDANTPSGTDPETGRSVRANKLYRVPGPTNTTYSEWAWDGTKYTMLANKDYGIDDVPTVGSYNIVKSGGIYDSLKYTKEIKINEITALEGWQPLERPVTGLVYISTNRSIMLAPSEERAKAVFIFNGGDITKGVYVWLDRLYTSYNNNSQINNFEATIKCVDIEDVFGGNVSPSYTSGWQRGYYLDDVFHSGGNDDWQFCTLNVEPGKYYLVPFCNIVPSAVQAIVNLDANGNFVSINKVGEANVAFNTFAVIKAATAKIGITYRLDCWNIGTEISASGLLKLPYLCLSDCKMENPYNFGLSILDKLNSVIDTNQYKNLELLMNFEMTKVGSWNNGYFDILRGKMETEAYGDWRYSIIDVVAGSWYLINTAVGDRIRVADVDGDDNVSENTSVQQFYYNISSNDRSSWILIKPKYNKLCLSFIDPSTRGYNTSFQYPKYCKLDRTSNNGLPFLFLQAMATNSKALSLDFEMVKEWENGYYDYANNRLETEVYGSWRYAFIPVEANAIYVIETSLLNNLRLADVDEQGNLSVNRSIPEQVFKGNDDKIRSTFVVPKYDRLCISFLDPARRNNPSDYYLPRYAKVSTKTNLFGDIWRLINSNKKEFIVKKSGGGDYTSLTEAIMDNFGIWGVTLHVEEGVYDLFEELEDYYGTADFLPLTPSTRGLELGFDITIKSSPKALIKADYEGHDTGIQTYFSAFNCYNKPHTGGFSLIGVNIQASRIRYCVHDEKGSNAIGNYTNIYQNCNMYLNNTDNDVWHSACCIGIGLGSSGNIYITGCICESVDPQYHDGTICSHTNRNANTKSRVTCIGNYLKGTQGYFRFNWYGLSQEITEVILEGNNVSRLVESHAETSPDDPQYAPSPYQNVVIYEWNEFVRTP